MSEIILDKKTASGEILLYHIWKERSSGYNDETVEDAKLEVSKEGNILLKLSYEHTSFAPNSGGKHNELDIYSIPVCELIKLIRRNGVNESFNTKHEDIGAEK